MVALPVHSISCIYLMYSIVLYFYACYGVLLFSLFPPCIRPLLHFDLILLDLSAHSLLSRET